MSEQQDSSSFIKDDEMVQSIVSDWRAKRSQLRKLVMIDPFDDSNTLDPNCSTNIAFGSQDEQKLSPETISHSVISGNQVEQKQMSLSTEQQSSSTSLSDSSKISHDLSSLSSETTTPVMFVPEQKIDNSLTSAQTDISYEEKCQVQSSENDSTHEQTTDEQQSYRRCGARLFGDSLLPKKLDQQEESTSCETFSIEHQVFEEMDEKPKSENCTKFLNRNVQEFSISKKKIVLPTSFGKMDFIKRKVSDLEEMAKNADEKLKEASFVLQNFHNQISSNLSKHQKYLIMASNQKKVVDANKQILISGEYFVLKYSVSDSNICYFSGTTSND